MKQVTQNIIDHIRKQLCKQMKFSVKHLAPSTQSLRSRIFGRIDLKPHGDDKIYVHTSNWDFNLSQSTTFEASESGYAELALYIQRFLEMTIRGLRDRYLHLDIGVPIFELHAVSDKSQYCLGPCRYPRDHVEFIKIRLESKQYWLMVEGSGIRVLPVEAYDGVPIGSSNIALAHRTNGSLLVDQTVSKFVQSRSEEILSKARGKPFNTSGVAETGPSFVHLYVKVDGSWRPGNAKNLANPNHDCCVAVDFRVLPSFVLTENKLFKIGTQLCLAEGVWGNFQSNELTVCDCPFAYKRVRNAAKRWLDKKTQK